MDTERDDAIRRRAYALWESEGRPAGRHEEHWRRAAEAEDGETDVHRRSGRAVPFEDLSNEGSTD